MGTQGGLMNFNSTNEYKGGISFKPQPKNNKQSAETFFAKKRLSEQNSNYELKEIESPMKNIFKDDSIQPPRHELDPNGQTLFGMDNISKTLQFSPGAELANFEPPNAKALEISPDLHLKFFKNHKFEPVDNFSNYPSPLRSLQQPHHDEQS